MHSYAVCQWRTLHLAAFANWYHHWHGEWLDFHPAWLSLPFCKWFYFSLLKPWFVGEEGRHWFNSLPFKKNNIFANASDKAAPGSACDASIYHYCSLSSENPWLGLFMLSSAALTYCLPKCRVCMESGLQPSLCYFCRQRTGGSQPNSSLS